MSTEIRVESIPSIQRSLRFYIVAAYVTGVLLLLLVAEMILKYALHLEVEVGGPFGAVALVAADTVTAFNLSLWILIIHGWFYVVYLISCYVVWVRMKWEIGWLLAMAAGGVVPFLSFITEALMSRRARRQIAEAEVRAGEREREDARLSDVEAGLSAQERAQLDADVEAEVRRRRDATGPAAS